MVPVVRGNYLQEEPGRGTLPGVVGWVLRHRRVLVIAYLVLLHGLVYFALTHGVFSRVHASQCTMPAAGALSSGSTMASGSGGSSGLLQGGADSGAAVLGNVSGLVP